MHDDDPVLSCHVPIGQREQDVPFRKLPGPQRCAAVEEMRRMWTKIWMRCIVERLGE